MREPTDRSERILTLMLLQSMKGQTQREKAVQLSLAGFSNIEIANLLDTTPQVVSSLLYEARKSKSSKKGQAQRRGSKRATRGKR